MVKVNQINSAHCKNWTYILKLRKYITFWSNYQVNAEVSKKKS